MLVVSADDVTICPVGTTRISPGREIQLIDSYLAGDTAADLAVRYGISRTSVKQILRRHSARKRNT